MDDIIILFFDWLLVGNLPRTYIQGYLLWKSLTGSIKVVIFAGYATHAVFVHKISRSKNTWLTFNLAAVGDAALKTRQYNDYDANGLQGLFDGIKQSGRSQHLCHVAVGE